MNIEVDFTPQEYADYIPKQSWCVLNTSPANCSFQGAKPWALAVRQWVQFLLFVFSASHWISDCFLPLFVNFSHYVTSLLIKRSSVTCFSVPQAKGPPYLGQSFCSCCKNNKAESHVEFSQCTHWSYRCDTFGCQCIHSNKKWP